MNQLQDILDQDLDPVETREWTDSLKSITQADGPDRAHYLLQRMVEETRRAGGHLPFQPTTEYDSGVSAVKPWAWASSSGSQKANTLGQCG